MRSQCPSLLQHVIFPRSFPDNCITNILFPLLALLPFWICATSCEHLWFYRSITMRSVCCVQLGALLTISNCELNSLRTIFVTLRKDWTCNWGSPNPPALVRWPRNSPVDSKAETTLLVLKTAPVSFHSQKLYLQYSSEFKTLRNVVLTCPAETPKPK